MNIFWTSDVRSIYVLCLLGWGVEEFFWSGRSMWKGWSIFGGGTFRAFRNSNYKFYFTALIWRTIYMQTERCCITCYFSLCFYLISRFIKSFFLLVFYLIAYWRKKVCRSWHRWVLKYLKSAIFLSVLKLNEKRKLPFKKYALERGDHKNIFAGGGVDL